MVKGISRQVIVVQAPETKLFEQAIFILKENAVGEGISDEALLKEAQKAIHGVRPQEKRRHHRLFCLIWAGLGALITGMVWLITAIIF